VTGWSLSMKFIQRILLVIFLFNLPVSVAGVYQNLLKEKIPQIRYCHKKKRLLDRDDPTKKNKNYIIKLDIAPDGLVTQLELGGRTKLTNKEISCLETIFYNMKFPSTGKDVTIQLPINFYSNKNPKPIRSKRSTNHAFNILIIIVCVTVLLAPFIIAFYIGLRDELNKPKTNYPQRFNPEALFQEINEFLNHFEFSSEQFIDSARLAGLFRFDTISNPVETNENIFVGNFYTQPRYRRHNLLSYIPTVHRFLYIKNHAEYKNVPAGYYISELLSIDSANNPVADIDKQLFKKITEYTGLFFKANDRLIIIYQSSTPSKKIPKLKDFLKNYQ
jgi:hypothetical protein